MWLTTYLLSNFRSMWLSDYPPVVKLEVYGGGGGFGRSGWQGLSARVSREISLGLSLSVELASSAGRCRCFLHDGLGTVISLDSLVGVVVGGVEHVVTLTKTAHSHFHKNTCSHLYIVHFYIDT